jgi:CheY-like chemotaxis protein
MPTRVLIVDPNESFAMLLKEGLEADREFRAIDVSNGQSALAALEADPFDLVILDLGLDDPEPVTLLRAIRAQQPELPIMIIPLDGDSVPLELVPFDIRGALTKPFFLPDLPARVAEALGRPLPAPASLSTTAGPGSPPVAPKAHARRLPRITLPKDDPRLSGALGALAETLNAEAVLLTSGSALVAHAGPIGRSEAEVLMRRILDARADSSRSSWTAGGAEQVRFGQSIAESGEHLLYSIDVADGVVLTLAVRPDSSLRLIRAQTRQTAQALLALGKQAS